MSPARFLIGTVPFVGHVTPLLPIARALVERGHEVAWYTGSKFRPNVEAIGARYVPMRVAPDLDDQDLEAHFPTRRRLRGLAALNFDIKHVFGDSAVGQFRDYQEILRELRPDSGHPRASTKLRVVHVTSEQARTRTASSLASSGSGQQLPTY